MGIVDIELDGAEDVLDFVVLDVGAVQEVLVLAADHHLAGDGDLVVVVISNRTLLLVSVVERDGHGGFGHTGLAVLVDQLLEVRSADLRMTKECDNIKKMHGAYSSL